jgi:antitoxin ParD1/3/4
MNVSLTPELEKLVRQKVDSGLYLSASEVVREALRLLEERDRMRALKSEEIRKEIQVGIDQAERGESAPLDLPATLAKVRSRRRNRTVAPDGPDPPHTEIISK